MKARCIEAVEKTLGRKITKTEAQGIEARIVKAMRFAAQDDPAYAAMGRTQQLQEAAKRAADGLKQEAALNRRRVILTIQAHDRLQNHIEDLSAQGINGIDALKRTLVFVADNKSNFLSHESLTKAIEKDSFRKLINTFEATDPRLWGLMEDKEGVVLLTKALFGETTGNAKIDAGAQAWLTTAEGLRQRMNDAGGQIGHLENWALPQHHDQLKVSKAGRDQWIKDVFDKLDRKKYVNEDGSLAEILVSRAPKG